MRKSLLFALAFALGLACCQPKETKLYVATINDMHANIDNFPMLANVVDSLRDLYPDLLLFSAGDNRSGNPFNDRFSEPSRPMIDLMNAVGFDLCALGNHEWDGGPSGLHDMMEWADFPFVCCNAYFDDSLDIHVDPYVVFERNGLKIGVVGGIQIGLNGIPAFHPKNGCGSHFDSLANVIPQYLGLRDECNALFLLSHCGFEEDIELAERFPQFDAIFGGHSHTLVNDSTFVNGVMITQAMNRVKYLTLSVFTFDKNGKMIRKESHNIPITSTQHINAEVQTMVDGFNNNEVFMRVLGYNDAPIVDGRECMGCLMADAYREAAGADMAFQNYGGVRIDSLGARPILLKDIYSLDPFNNGIVSLTMTGQEIVDFLGVSVYTDHGPNFCSGCSYTFSLDEEGRMTECAVTLDDGKPLRMDKKYKVAMNNFMILSFQFNHEDPGASISRSSNETLIDYLEAHPHINYTDVNRVYQTSTILE